MLTHGIDVLALIVCKEMQRARRSGWAEEGAKEGVSGRVAEAVVASARLVMTVSAPAIIATGNPKRRLRIANGAVKPGENRAIVVGKQGVAVAQRRATDTNAAALHGQMLMGVAFA